MCIFNVVCFFLSISYSIYLLFFYARIFLVYFYFFCISLQFARCLTIHFWASSREFVIIFPHQRTYILSLALSLSLCLCEYMCAWAHRRRVSLCWFGFFTYSTILLLLLLFYYYFFIIFIHSAIRQARVLQMCSGWTSGAQQKKKWKWNKVLLKNSIIEWTTIEFCNNFYIPRHVFPNDFSPKTKKQKWKKKKCDIKWTE